MGGFTPFSTAAPNMGKVAAGGTPNPLMLLLGALASIPAQAQAKKTQDTELADKQAQTKLAQQQTSQQATTFQQTQQDRAKEQAKTTWTTLGQRVMANPDWAKSPTVRKQLEDSANALGFPSPYNEDGTLNQNAFLNPLSSLPPDANGEKVREFILAQPPGAQRINAAKSAGITLTDAEANVASSFTAKAQTDITRAAQQGVHLANADATAASRAASLKVMQEAEAHRFDADANLYNQKAQVVQQLAGAAVTRSNAAMLSAQAHMVSAQAAVKRAEQSLRGNQGLASRFYATAHTSWEAAQKAYAEADAAYEDALKNGADDSVLQPLSAKRAGAQAGMAETKSQLDLLGVGISGNSGHATSVQSQSGSGPVTVTDAGGAKPPFKVPAGYTAKQQGGKWGVVDGSGTFYPYTGK